MCNKLSGSGYWKDVKKIIGYNNSTPSTIDGVQGSDAIAELFKTKYDELYNSVSYDAYDMNIPRTRLIVKS